MSVTFTRRICLITLLVFAALFCHYLLSQTIETSSAPTSTTAPDQITKKLAGTQHQWRATVVDPKTQRDTVPPSIRAARNAMWEPFLLDIRNMETNGGVVTLPIGGSPLADVSLDPKEIWVIATFDHFLVIPIDSESKLIYTEMSFKINQIIHQPHTSYLNPGQLFDVDEVGGRIKKENGKIETWHLISSQYSPQPGHTYLMLIGRNKGDGNNGDLYIIEKRWDLSTGRAVPDQESVNCQDLSGKQVICGQTTQDAIAYLQSVLPIDDSK